MTVSIRKDELEVIDRLVKEYGVKRHEVLKLAIRTFLFPREKEHIIDGRRAIVETLSIPMPVAKHPEELEKYDTLAEKKIIIVRDDRSKEPERKAILKKSEKNKEKVEGVSSE